ncbi:glycosyltransferase family 4 protein [Pseudoflavitalea sp. G-6-1-2]|uniref:glycosyltransferase family 4 protein n=1 Tax=Pseudoflavitalea sp. G-6-1-2 TaxID=2728841 RepID=UPI001469F63B|nr:glycosyltransferase family 4 protein [Pseudoflavitalea sp. G-6-1-2]NML20613.1 glycosyltransferase family 4 protein [Pseudoflavitalea sp. G-6-1-2]
MRIALITNIPAPYWIATWNYLSGHLKDDFTIFFCSSIEPNRQWELPEMKFKHVFLKEKYNVKKDGSTVVHNNKEIWGLLKKYNPDIVVTGGFNPTMLYGIAYTKLFRKKHIAISDAWEKSEEHLGSIHMLIRKLIYGSSQALLACSNKGKEYFRRFGNEKKIFVTHYSIDHTKFANNYSHQQRLYDLLFAGQLIDRKNPEFFVRVALGVQKKYPSLRILLLGAGPLKDRILENLNNAGINYSYPGHAQQSELPEYYGQSRIFLFPTSFDAWGVVAHESLSAGTPVITTPYAGCSDELVMNNINGFVLPLEEDKWIEKCLELLQNESRWQTFSDNAVQSAAQINSKEAAEAILNAFEFVMKKNR